MTYGVFLSGETVDLCVPTRQAIADGWADWFNNPEITRWLDQGPYPNHVEDQQAFLESIQKRSRFAVPVGTAHSIPSCNKDYNEIYQPKL